MRKSKKVLGILISVCMLISLVPTFASAAAGDTFTAGDFTYKVNTDTTTVTLTAIAATKLTGAVTVPATVSDGTSTYTVTHLGDAFKGTVAAVATKTTEMTSLVLPDTMTKFTGTATFYGCKFTSIHLPKNLTGDSTTAQLNGTFKECRQLTTVTLPAAIRQCWATFQGSTVRTVIITGTEQVDFYQASGTSTARAWSDNAGAVTVYYPEGGAAPYRITGYGVTGTATALASTFTSGDFTYTVNADGETVTLTAIAAEKLTGEVIVPEAVTSGLTYTVTQLGDAFKNQGAKTVEMTSLVLPDTITKFTGTATFYDCKGLEFIKLPKNLTGDTTTGQLTKTFYFCSKLTSVTLPAGITRCWGTFASGSGVRTVVVTGPSQVDFYQASGTADARAWADNIGAVTVYYPEGGTAPYRITGYGVTGTAVNKTIAEMPLYISAVNASGATATVNVLNYNDVAKNGNMNIFCAYYSKADDSLVDIGIASLTSVSAYDVEEVTVNMTTSYDADSVYVKAFVWEEETLDPFADARTLN